MFITMGLGLQQNDLTAIRRLDELKGKLSIGAVTDKDIEEAKGMFTR